MTASEPMTVSEECAACGRPIKNMRVEMTVRLRIKGKSELVRRIFCSLSCPIIKASRKARR